MARIVEFRSSEQPHMSVSESLYYRLAEPLVFRDLDGVLGDITAACCRRCGEVTLRSDEVANHLCITGERTERLIERGMEAFRAIVERKDADAALAAERARAEAAEQALRKYAVLHYTTRDDGLAIRCLECQAERGLASFSESRHLDHKPSCILQAADQRGGEEGE